ncbi:hypothetical protein IWZ00DRAFT_316760 [Phyllosticta capitalensis]
MCGQQHGGWWVLGSWAKGRAIVSCGQGGQSGRFSETQQQPASTYLLQQCPRSRPPTAARVCACACACACACFFSPARLVRRASQANVMGAVIVCELADGVRKGNRHLASRTGAPTSPRRAVQSALFRHASPYSPVEPPLLPCRNRMPRKIIILY